MRHFCNSLLLCGIACLCVPTAQAQDVTIRRVKTKLTAMMLLTSAIALTVAGTAFIMWGQPTPATGDSHAIMNVGGAVDVLGW